jgi:hypothetical protein
MALQLFAALLAVAQAAPRIWTADESVKVRPSDPPARAGPLRIQLAAVPRSSCRAR